MYIDKFYCEKNDKYEESINWKALYDEVQNIPPDFMNEQNEPVFLTKDLEFEKINQKRISTNNHLVRNGNGPITSVGKIDINLRDLEYGTEKDKNGGVRVFAKSLGIYGTLRCPECLSPIRCEPEDGQRG